MLSGLANLLPNWNRLRRILPDLDRLKDVFLEWDRPVILAGFSICWGLVVAFPWLHTFRSAPSYANMATIPTPWLEVNEFLWGAAVLSIGVWNLWTYWRCSRRWQRISWIVNAGQGAFMGLEFFWANSQSSFTLCFFWHSLSCLMVAYHLKAEMESGPQ